jgi:hypothetical protein
MRWRTYSGLARLLLRLESVGWAATTAHVHDLPKETII